MCIIPVEMHRHATKGGCGGGEVGSPLLPFLKIEKSALIFWKKAPDSFHFWIKYSIENVVLRVSWRKNSKIFPVGPFFVFLTNFLSKCPNIAKPPLPWKISGCAHDKCHNDFDLSNSLCKISKSIQCSEEIMSNQRCIETT